MSVTTVRCAKCDTVFDGEPYTTAIQSLGHPDCPNAACNPELAKKLAEQKAQEEREHGEYLQWRADRAAGKV